MEIMEGSQLSRLLNAEHLPLSTVSQLSTSMTPFCGECVLIPNALLSEVSESSQVKLAFSSIILCILTRLHMPILSMV